MVKEPTTKAPTKATKKPKSPTVAKKRSSEPGSHQSTSQSVHHKISEKPPVTKGKYIFATGRRKTAIANVRLFSGQSESLVNKIPFKQYFGYIFHQHEILKPFELTGLKGDYYFVANLNGGGQHAQAGALSHGISTALGKISEEVRKVLKKNGLLTRDDRKKERKKPGLKRARRSPQWAKR